MPKFCPECAAALDADAKFCPSCRARVGVAAALGSEIRGEMKARFRAVADAPGMQVPPPIWAGVIEVFGCLVTLIQFVATGAAFGTIVVAAGVAGLAGKGAEVERIVVWVGLYLVFYLALLSFQLPLVYGFFALKRWAYGLYLWSIGPFVLGSLVLSFAKPEAVEAAQKTAGELPLGVSFVLWTAVIMAVALLGTQIFLVLRSKEHLVN